MATVSDNAQAGYADADEFIRYQIEHARSRIKATDLLTAVVLAGLLLVGYLLTFTLLDHWVVDGGFSAWTRALMLGTVLLVAAAIVVRYVIRPWFRTIHPLFAARMLDDSSEGMQGSLLALVDLQAAGRKIDVPIHRTLEKRAAVSLAQIHVDETIDRRLLMRLGSALFAITVLTCLYAVFSPKSISLLRPLTLAQATVATRTVVDNVQPGNTTVPAGSQMEFIADISGVIPETVQVLFSTEDKRSVDEPLQMHLTDDEHRFRVLMVGEGDRGVRQNLQYRVVAGDASSEVFTITVDQPPTARVTEVRYKYPDYMHLPERADSSGAIEAWEDTTVTILAESSVPIEIATLQLSDDATFTVRGEELSMQIADKALSVDLKLEDREDGTFPKFYRIQVTDADKNSDPEPVVYPLEIRKDQPPVIRLLDPTRDLQVAANAIVPLLVEAEDPDFLLRSVTLHYSINGRPIQPAENLLDAVKTGLTKRWVDSWDFKLAPLNLKAGDVVSFHLQARDNRPPLGNQSRTGDLNLQITPPLSETAVQGQLAQDREMQEQQKNERQDAQSAAGEATEPTTATEQSEPAAATGEEPNGEPQPGDTSEKSEQNNSDQKAQPKSSETPGDVSPNADDKSAKNADHSQQSQDADSQQSQTGDKSAQDTRPAADDNEALQRIIEKMNRDRNSRSLAPSGPSDSSEVSPKDGDPLKQESKSGDNPATEQPSVENPSSDDAKSGSDKPGETVAPDTEQSTSEPRPDASEEESMKGNGQSQPRPKETDRAGDQSMESGSKDDPKPPAADDSQEPSPDKPASDAGNPTADEENSADSNGKDRTSKPESGEKSGSEKSGSEKSGSEKSGSEKSGSEKSGSEKSGSEKSGSEKSGSEKSGSEKSSSEKSGSEKSGSEKSGSEKSGSEKSGSEKSGSEKSGSEKSGSEKSGSEKSGSEKSGSEKSGSEKSGSEKSGSEKSGSEKPGSEKPGSEKSGGEKSGQQSGEGKTGEGKSGEGKSGEGKSGEGKSGEGKAGEGKAGEGKSGEGKAGEGKAGEGKSGEGKSGEGKAGEGKSGEGKSGEGKSGEGKSGEGKSGEGKSGEGKSGEGKSGEGKAGEGKAGEGKAGEGKAGEGKAGEGKGGNGKPGKGKSGKGKSGGGGSGAQDAAPGEANPAEGSDDKYSKQKGNAAGGADRQNDGDAEDAPRTGNNNEAPETNNPEVDQAAEAAGLALKLLEQDLQRGKVDPELLKELGWTPAEVKTFLERIQKQLDERGITEQERREKSLSQKSFEEMLKSLDVNSTGKTREGSSAKDRDQQDTTGRQTTPPNRYKQWNEFYQRSMSGVKDGKGPK